MGVFGGEARKAGVLMRAPSDHLTVLGQKDIRYDIVWSLHVGSERGITAICTQNAVSMHAAQPDRSAIGRCRDTGFREKSMLIDHGIFLAIHKIPDANFVLGETKDVPTTGAGIAPEDLERLGRPYEQAGDVERRAQGTGLGLSLVKALAGLHGGAMSIESAVGEGAAVTVRMPVLVAPDAQEAPEAETAPTLETEPVDEAALAIEIDDAAQDAEPLATESADAIPDAGEAAAGPDLTAELPAADNVTPFRPPGGAIVNLPGPRA